MKKSISVLHMIDALAAGGAERMAVNMTNLLNQEQVSAWLCATRVEGPLKELIAVPDRYVFLGKSHTLDFRAFSALIALIKRERIALLHAHSSSLGWAVLAKRITGARVIWHDHYGNSEFLTRRKKSILRMLCRSADHVISVNDKLVHWAIKELRIPTSQVSYVPNFPSFTVQNRTTSSEKRINEIPVIICLANLRPAKDHFTLVRALHQIKQEGLNFRVWLVGAEFQDEYSQTLRSLIQSLGLEQQVEFLGIRTDISELLQQADIGVLSSSTEGLPVALLEYGLAGLPVVATDVGQCAQVIGRAGMVVQPGDAAALASSLQFLLDDHTVRMRYGQLFKDKINSEYSPASVYSQLMNVYANVLNS